MYLAIIFVFLQITITCNCSLQGFQTVPLRTNVRTLIIFGVQRPNPPIRKKPNLERLNIRGRIARQTGLDEEKIAHKQLEAAISNKCCIYQRFLLAGQMAPFPVRRMLHAVTCRLGFRIVNVSDIHPVLGLVEFSLDLQYSQNRSSRWNRDTENTMDSQNINFKAHVACLHLSIRIQDCKTSRHNVFFWTCLEILFFWVKKILSIGCQDTITYKWHTFFFYFDPLKDLALNLN